MVRNSRPGPVRCLQPSKSACLSFDKRCILIIWGSASNSRNAHPHAHSQTRRVSARPESDRDRTPASAMGRSAKRDEAMAEASFARYMKPVRFGSPGSPPGAAGEDVFSNTSLSTKAADVTSPPPDARAGAPPAGASRRPEPPCPDSRLRRLKLQRSRRTRDARARSPSRAPRRR